MEKRCSTCLAFKSPSEFHVAKKHKDGLSYSCKDCVKAKTTKWYLENKEIVRKKQNENYDPEKNRQQCVKYREKHRNELSLKRKQARKADPERFKKMDREKYLKRKDAVRIQSIEYRSKNRAKINARAKVYRDNNKEKVSAAIYAWYLRKYKADTEFRILCNLRSRLGAAVRGKTKSASTIALLGCTIPELMDHIKAKFRDGMTWDNYGTWELDHVRACAHFSLTDPAQQRECFHYTNLQPLWKKENQSKGARLTAR